MGDICHGLVLRHLEIESSGIGEDKQLLLLTKRRSRQHGQQAYRPAFHFLDHWRRFHLQKIRKEIGGTPRHARTFQRMIFLEKRRNLLVISIALMPERIEESVVWRRM